MPLINLKYLYVFAVAAPIAAATFYLYPAGDELVKKVRTHSFVYNYALPADISPKESAPVLAAAVPVLMYHGVIRTGPVGPNTSRRNFIAQMEALKKEGYETISVDEYQRFREGNFALPPKPVIITFDDGRKDSFYPVDEILKKLGFKATLFVATVRPNQDDVFYLGWDELKEASVTGRWEIEAHGRRSHEEIPISQDGSHGKYYTSRLYVPGKGLESVEEYEKRLEEDYRNGINDLKEHLGVEAKYFAIPLSNYGITYESNYEGSYAFNQLLTKKYFKLAFTQAHQELGSAGENGVDDFYNYRSSPPTTLRRLEVRDKTADELLALLRWFAPKPPSLAFPAASQKEFDRDARLLYGSLSTSSKLTLSSSSSSPSARMVFGSTGWSNYSLKARLLREKGRSVSLLANYIDENNFVSLDWGEDSVKIMERKEGRERELASYYPWRKEGEVEILLLAYDNYVSAYFSGIFIGRAKTGLAEGSAGFGVWDPQGARSSIRLLEIKSLDAI